MEQSDEEDFIVGEPQINSTLSVIDIMRRYLAIQEKVQKAVKLYGRNPTPENQQVLDDVRMEFIIFSMKKYVPA